MQVKSCELTLPKMFDFTPPNAEKLTIDIGSGKYHLLLASGPLNSEDPGFHDKMTGSSEPVNLKLVQTVKATKSALPHVHGILMIIAWIASAGSGMLIARYFKKTWTSIK